MEESNTIQEQQPTGDSSSSASAASTASAAPAALTPEQLKKEQIRKYYMELQKQNYEKCIEVVMNQTTYTREEAIASLQKHKGNVMHVVKEFLGVPEKNEHEKSGGSLNQKRYGVIRDFMDKAAIGYMKAQERNKVVNEMLEKQKKAREEAAASNTNRIVSSTEPSS
jgi:NACalpha-BTF3-like transcription factor